MVSIKGFLAIAIASASLSACYVVPLQQYPAVNSNYGSSVSVAPTVVVRPVYTARLYPVNESASSMGRIAGTISNPERGHGEFSFSVGSETFAGEATRAPNSSKGTANAAGNRGGFVKCDYTMSSSALGSGTCQFSSGARYDMHISL